MKQLVLPLIGFLAMTAPALAQSGDPASLGAFGSWNAYYFMDGPSKVCFMSSAPEKQEGQFKKRGEVLLFITHWPAENTKNVVTISAGYPYRKESTATVTVDGQDFSLSTTEEMAWARDQEMDNALAAALSKGTVAIVKGTSKRGTLTTDTYNLKGSGDAYKAISKECDI